MPSAKPLPTLQAVTQELLHVSQQCTQLSLLLHDYRFQLETQHAGQQARQSEELVRQTLAAIAARLQGSDDA